MKTKRVFRLKKGDVFVWMGTEYLVYDTPIGLIKYKPLNVAGGIKTHYSFSAGNQMKVEIVELVQPYKFKK